MIHLKSGQRLFGSFLCYFPCTHHLGVVSDATQQAVCHPWRAPGAPGDLPDAALLRLDAQQACRALDDGGYGVLIVEVQAVDRAEAVAQRGAEHGEAGGGPDQCEMGQIESYVPGSGPFAQYDIESEILHRGVQLFLDYTIEPMYFIDEQDVMLLEAGDYGGDVAGTLYRRAGRRPDVHAHLGGDDVGQRGFAQTRRAVKQNVIQGLSPALRRSDGDL